MTKFARVELVLEGSVPKRVIVDGAEIQNVAAADVQLRPGNLLQLVLTINVSKVITRPPTDVLIKSDLYRYPWIPVAF